ncbi:LysR substrate-binding domain-containing protein [Hwanghaeella sp.]|uniref:LysR substrate-binding domain-containing protein n=1 Tax=Hwanghaeella sp. TaxID=2605943 RepID=UPI003CCBDE77
MLQTLPSLASLRAFEAAARHGSFKAAAEELSVTPTAVSHHVRGLEEAFEVQLFRRSPRAVHLTESGQQLADRLAVAFTEIQDAVRELRATEHELTVTTTPAFAALWLVPRLEAFQNANPGISLRLDTGTDVVDLTRDRRVDLAIRYGAEDGPLVHKTLPREQFGLYGTPDYLARIKGQLDEATILSTRWRHSGLSPVTTEAWLTASGIHAKPGSRRLDQEHHVVQCALAGQGLALLSQILASDLCSRGLLAPFRPETHLPGFSYSVLCLPERRRVRKIARFVEWLQHEVSD